MKHEDWCPPYTTLLQFVALITMNTRIGNVRPSLKDLHDRVVVSAADKWKGLGVQLLPQSDLEQLLQVIETDHPRDAINCCKRVLEKWLDTSDATWSQLIRALRSPSIQLDYLAGQLEQMMIEECELLCIILINACIFSITRVVLHYSLYCGLIKNQRSA